MSDRVNVGSPLPGIELSLVLVIAGPHSFFDGGDETRGLLTDDN